MPSPDLKSAAVSVGRHTGCSLSSATRKKMADAARGRYAELYHSQFAGKILQEVEISS